MRREVQGLTGGKKQFWLRVHRREVENYLSAHGPEATMAEFGLMPRTLDGFLARKSKDDRVNRLTDNDRYVLRLSMEASRTVAGRVRELEDRVEALENWWNEDKPLFDLGRAYIKATMPELLAKVKIPALLNDPLRLDQLCGKSKK